MPSQESQKYIDLIRGFVDGQVPVRQFEATYLAMFKKEPGFLPEDEFRILDKLFADVDALVPDTKLVSHNDLDERQLRAECGEALRLLLREPITRPRRGQFSLMMIFVGVGLAAFLVSQGPPLRIEVTAYSDDHLRAYEVGEYRLNERFLIALGAEALLIVGYRSWRRRTARTR